MFAVFRACTAQDYDLQDLIHLRLQLLVDMRFFHCREVAQMNAFRSLRDLS